MKKLLLVALTMLLSMAAFSQTSTIYSDNFESYNAGEYIAAENPAWWVTWDNLPGTYQDGLISNDYAFSGTRSVLVDNDPGAADLVLKLGDKTTGKYNVKWKMYIENNCGGHYNIQHFETLGTEWACQVWFNGDGSGVLEVYSFVYNFNFPLGTWFSVENIIDLDNDWIRLVINGVLVHEWPFSYNMNNTAGTNQLGGFDFFAATYDGAAPKYYIDDVAFLLYVDTEFYSDDFESYNAGEYIAVENPAWWVTWDNLPGTYQDGLISNDYAFSGTRSVLVDNVPGAADLVLKLGDKTTDRYIVSWKMYIENNCGGHYNIQHFEALGTEWACQVWFNGDGSGVLEVYSFVYNFNFPLGTWFTVENLIDLNNDWIRLVINGVLVHEWPFSYNMNNTAGTNQLGGFDFFAATYDGATPKYYIDDVNFMRVPGEAIPISNWAIFLTIGLISIFTLFVWWRRK